MLFCWQEGYRNGVEIGEETCIQDGHDNGFQRTSRLFHLARIRGAVVYVCCRFFCGLLLINELDKILLFRTS